MVKVKDTVSFIRRAIEVHGDRYDYSHTVWNGSRNPIIIICKVCGPIALSEASTHCSTRKSGCENCNHAAAMDRKRKHPKKQKNCCKKCGSETYRRSAICKGCTVPAVCGCGKPVRSRYAIHCSSCCEWGKALASSANAIGRRQRRMAAIGKNKWLKWAVTKQCVLLNRSRINTDRHGQSSVVNMQWCDWAEHSRKTKLRGIESAWQKKCRNWQRGLSTRSRVEQS